MSSVFILAVSVTRSILYSRNCTIHLGRRECFQYRRSPVAYLHTGCALAIVRYADRDPRPLHAFSYLLDNLDNLGLHMEETHTHDKLAIPSKHTQIATVSNKGIR